MTSIAAMALAGLADALTLDPRYELNPFAATAPALAVVAKGCLVLILALWPWAYRNPLCLIAAAVWSVGFASNLAGRI